MPIADPKSELYELARCLRQERLYVSYEKKQLQQLNESLAGAGRRLGQAAWTTSMQRDNLEGLVMSRGDSTPQHACQVANLLHQTPFTDAYKQLSHHMVSYSEFLASLRNNPNLVAECLAHGDKLNLSYMSEIVMIVFSSLLGSCVLPEDETILVKILHKLVEMQLLEAANPRKLLRHGTSSFSRLYRSFSDQLFSSRLFLTSALYEPILSLLTEDEIFLDIDPAKAVIRFPPQERLRRFGAEGSEGYEAALGRHRQTIIAKLAGHANRFILGIKDNFHCLPSFLSNLVRTIFTCMEAQGKESKEIWAVCTDVLFNSFICPAIVDPEPKGIIDMPISYRARFNLMQVAQILQVLALWKWEEINPHHKDLYRQFDENLVPGLLESILSQDRDEVRRDVAGLETSRMAVLITADQIQNITEWLQAVREMEGVDIAMRGQLESLMQPLPGTVPGRKKSSLRGDKTDGASNEGDAIDGGEKELNFGQRHKTALAARLSSVGVKGRQSGGGRPVNESLAQANPDKVLVIPITDAPSELPGLASEESVLSLSRAGERDSNHQGRVRMNLTGLEEAVSFPRDGSLTSASGEVQEKRTRFSLSHDDGSIGNTSDNLEAISGAASNHSVASSLEDEVDPVEDPIIDNLSDMVSANVSGRGTPNVSGRDTPSSQVTEGEGEERPAGDGVEEQPNEPEEVLMGDAQGNNNLLNGGRKNPEPDMEEKFGRFEIKPEVRRGRIGQLGGHVGREGDRDEAVSMVSDTWSTDVLSSDTETVGEPPTLEDLLRGRPGDEFSSRNRMLDHLQVPSGDVGHQSHGVSGNVGHLLDVAETGSEAWSMDVLASDSESFRLGDFDLEDSMSVARSDDTTRSDPDHINLQRLELTEYEGRVGTERGDMRGNQHGFHLVKNVAVEQWAELSRARNTAGAVLPGHQGKRRDSDGSSHSTKHESILKKPGAPSLSSTSVGEHSSVCLDDSAVTDSVCDPLPADMSNLSTSVRLSTTSIASSASSHGSGGSVEAVCPPLKSRSNSSASAGTSAGGSVHGTTSQDIGPGPSNQVVQASTGAIPKSISFDKSADKEEEGLVSDVKHSTGHGKRDRSFFKSWKLPKIGRRGGGGRGSKSEEYLRAGDNHRLTGDAFNIPEHAEGPCLRRAISDETKASAIENIETSDDILAKYRKKPDDDKVDGGDMDILQQREQEDECNPLQEMDRENMEASYVFQDARRKLRLVLSETELPIMNGRGAEGELTSLLTVMLAQAINQQDRSSSAQLRETLRCLSHFDQEGCAKLVRSLRDEYRRRSPYIAYLVRSRQGLLVSLATLEKVSARLESEQKMCSKFLISVCVRLFLERRDDELQQLQAQFSGTNLMDEKTELVVQFLNRLWNSLEMEPMLAATNDEQRSEARKAVERAIFSQIYMLAMYPNQEADASRDIVLQQHIARLADVVTPNHRDLKIPRRYQYECPWPAAQAELRRLAAFKMPADKVHCISRVSSIIMNLLSLAQDKSVPAADDFVPVLVFVIIKANPPSLLSTVQFVDNFYRDRLCGEECYWWMQFVGAVEFIKTMDYVRQ